MMSLRTVEHCSAVAHGHNWTYDTEHDVLLPVPVLLNHGAGSGEKTTGKFITQSTT